MKADSCTFSFESMGSTPVQNQECNWLKLAPWHAVQWWRAQLLDAILQGDSMWLEMQKPIQRNSKNTIFSEFKFLFFSQNQKFSIFFASEVSCSSLSSPFLRYAFMQLTAPQVLQRCQPERCCDITSVSYASGHLRPQSTIVCLGNRVYIDIFRWVRYKSSVVSAQCGACCCAKALLCQTMLCNCLSRHKFGESKYLKPHKLCI